MVIYIYEYTYFSLDCTDKNNSYSNSVVQALYFCKPFRQCVLNFPQASTAQICTPQPINPSSPSVNINNSNGHSYFPSTSSSSTSSSPALNGTRVNGTSTPLKETSSNKSRSSVNGNAASTPTPAAEKDQNNINIAPGMEDTLFSSLKDLFWKISTNKKKTGVIAPVNFINKVKKENGKKKNTYSIYGKILMYEYIKRII